MAATGALAAADLAWWEEPLIGRAERGGRSGPLPLQRPEERQGAQGRLELRTLASQAFRTRPVRLRLRGQGTWAVLYATEFMYANGAQVMKDGKVVINSKEAAEALDWYLDLFRKHKVCPPSVPTDGWRGIVEGFGRGITNTYIHNSGSAEEQKGFVGDKNFSTVPLPLGPAKKRASFYFSETLTAFNKGKSRDGAWRFMSWLMEDEPNLMYTKGLGLLPSRKSLSERPEFTADPAYQGFLKSFPFSMVSPYLAYAGWGGKIDSEGVPLFQQALVGKLSAKEFLDKFAEVLTKNMT